MKINVDQNHFKKGFSNFSFISSFDFILSFGFVRFYHWLRLYTNDRHMETFSCLLLAEMVYTVSWFTHLASVGLRVVPMAQLQLLVLEALT
jgi:hypothetical protein